MQCSGQMRCIPPSPADAWVSNITVSERVISARLEWAPARTPRNARYVVIWKNDTGMENFRETQAVRVDVWIELEYSRWTCDVM